MSLWSAFDTPKMSQSIHEILFFFFLELQICHSTARMFLNFSTFSIYAYMEREGGLHQYYFLLNF